MLVPRAHSRVYFFFYAPTSLFRFDWVVIEALWRFVAEVGVLWSGNFVCAYFDTCKWSELCGTCGLLKTVVIHFQAEIERFLAVNAVGVKSGELRTDVWK